MSSPETATEQWYILKQNSGHCEIVMEESLTHRSGAQEHWGPFASKSEAIARRVGLIRAGKCLPV